MRRIVVVYDDPASVTLEHAAELAESVGAELIITNVTAAIDVEDTAEAAARAQAKLEEARDGALLAETFPLTSYRSWDHRVRGSSVLPTNAVRI